MSEEIKFGSRREFLDHLAHQMPMLREKSFDASLQAAVIQLCLDLCRVNKEEGLYHLRTLELIDSSRENNEKIFVNANGVLTSRNLKGTPDTRSMKIIYEGGQFTMQQIIAQQREMVAAAVSELPNFESSSKNTDKEGGDFDDGYDGIGIS